MTEPTLEQEVEQEVERAEAEAAALDRLIRAARSRLLDAELELGEIKAREAREQQHLADLLAQRDGIKANAVVQTSGNYGKVEIWMVLKAEHANTAQGYHLHGVPLDEAYNIASRVVRKLPPRATVVDQYQGGE